MRDHEPVVINQFNGLYARGPVESVPLDHFSDCDNIQFIEGGVKTRDGVEVLLVDDEGFPIPIVRAYNYVAGGEQGLLVLDTLGNIYHTTSPTPTTPILSIATMTDFAFVAIGGRAYISPHNGVTGLEDEFLYVYFGDGNPARKAAGSGADASSIVVTQVPGFGNIEYGWHLFAVVFETNSGFLTAFTPSANTAFLAIHPSKVDLSGIPTSPDTFVVKRHLVATRAIDPQLFPDPATFTGDPEGFTYYFIPNATINNNTDTTFPNIEFFDSELLEEASPLIDNFEEIPAGVKLTNYHGRLVSIGEFGTFNTDPELDTFGNTSIARISNVGEPEAINQVDGLVIAPLEGNPLANAQEFRDVLYLFKKTRTYAVVDNGDVPSAWPITTLDEALGTRCHGIADVLDSGGVNIDFLLVATFAGLMLFNGTYIHPELSWKIADNWAGMDADDYDKIEVLNDPILKRIYIVKPDGTMLMGDYDEGLDKDKIRWTPWSFAGFITTITLINTSTLVLGSSGEL